MDPEKLSEFFEEELCIFNLRSRKKMSVLNEMANHLVEKDKITDKDFAVEMLRNRESLGSTGLGNGVAFPHGRSLAIQQLTLLFARSSRGVDFDAMDNKPTKIFFLVLAPSDKGAHVYLELLSELIGLVKNKKKLEKLFKVKDYETFQNIIRE